MILKKILNFGIDKNYFIKKPIKKIEKSCCSLEKEIIDFDNTKEIICKEANQQTRKSCDGLCLQGSINFIEFKSLNNFFEKEFQYKLNQENIEEIEIIEIIKEKVKDFNFKRKITDSLWLLDYILRHQDLSLSNSEIDKYDSIEKNYFVVKDEIIALVDLTINLNLLSYEGNSLKYRKIMDIEIQNSLNNIINIEVNKPKLLNCNELEKILKEENEQTDNI